MYSNFQDYCFIWSVITEIQHISELHSLAVNKSKSKTVKLQLVQMYSNFQDYCFIWSVTTEIQHLWASFINYSFILLLSIDLKFCNSFSVWFRNVVEVSNCFFFKDQCYLTDWFITIEWFDYEMERIWSLAPSGFCQWLNTL